jgi:hypothetical protein
MSADLETEAERVADSVSEPEIVIVPRPRIEQTELGDMDEDNAALYVSYRLRREIKPRTLQDWRLSGKGPKYISPPSGRPITYRETDIDRWLETRCLHDPQEPLAA